MKDDSTIQAVNDNELLKISGSERNIPLPELRPVAPPVYFTQAIGEDGNPPVEQVW